MTPIEFIMIMIFFLGFLCIIISIVNSYNKCPDNKVIYKYIPRSFVEDQMNPVPLDDIFHAMFNKPSPWITSFDDDRYLNLQTRINQYNISQS